MESVIACVGAGGICLRSHSLGCCPPWFSCLGIIFHFYLELGKAGQLVRGLAVSASQALGLLVRATSLRCSRRVLWIKLRCSYSHGKHFMDCCLSTQRIVFELEKILIL